MGHSERFEHGEAPTRMPLDTLAPSHNCQETKINTVPLNPGDEMSALPNTGLVARPERGSLSGRADDSVTTEPDRNRGCCFSREELASPLLPCLCLLPQPLELRWFGPRIRQ